MLRGSDKLPGPSRDVVAASPFRGRPCTWGGLQPTTQGSVWQPSDTRTALPTLTRGHWSDLGFHELAQEDLSTAPKSSRAPWELGTSLPGESHADQVHCW